MKLKLLSFLSAMIILASCSTTQTSTTDNQALMVPTNIQTSFNTLYPDAVNVTWSSYTAVPTTIEWEWTGWEPLGADDYVAQFDMSGERYYAYYDDTGEWIGTTVRVVDHNNLPTGVANALRNSYAGYMIEDIDREIYNDKIAYEVELKKTDDDKLKILFDSNGTVLKSKVKD